VHADGAGLLMKKAGMYLLLIILMALWARDAGGEDPQESAHPTADRQAIVLDIQGPIGPATRDFLVRSLETAADRDAALVIIRMDTPGGLDASTRDIIKAILNSPVPVATYVAPEGARAASAGTYILYASHIAAMSPATNVGAATPVSIIGSPGNQPPDPKTGEGEPENEKDEDSGQDGSGSADKTPGDSMTKKVVNDSVAYIRGLAEKRGRNADWAELAVREADSITSEKALELGVIDLIAKNVGDLLKKIDGMVVEVNGLDQELATNGLVIERLEPDWRSELLGVITSPTIAYLLLLIGVYGLILEGYNPGAMIAEVMAPSFGALGFGGIIAMVIGSIILIDTDVPGFGVSRALIGSIATVGSLGLMAIIWFAVKARQRPVVSGREQLIGASGTAMKDFNSNGEVFVHSERWHAITESPVQRDQDIVVTGIDGLTLTVRPAHKQTQERKDV
jgi:membrane-bound serine protease (ClpP class)